MNYSPMEFYDELYRIFSCNDELLSQTQTVLLGDCMRSLAAGENVTYKLERLHKAVADIPKIADPLENYLHQYIRYVEENDIDEDEDTESEVIYNDYKESYSQGFNQYT